MELKVNFSTDVDDCMLYIYIIELLRMEEIQHHWIDGLSHYL